MTMTLDAPTEAPDLVVIEEHQHDVPLVCTRGGDHDAALPDPCTARAEWEMLCMGCGWVTRRCAKHFMEEVNDARLDGDGVGSLCARCMTPRYIDQFVRIPA